MHLSHHFIAGLPPSFEVFLKFFFLFSRIPTEIIRDKPSSLRRFPRTVAPQGAPVSDLRVTFPGKKGPGLILKVNSIQ